MSNYYANTRTNYFRVIDEKRFKEIIFYQINASGSDIECWEKEINNEKYYAFGVYDEILGVCECSYCNGCNNCEHKEKSSEICDLCECESEYNFNKMCELLQELVHPKDAIIITTCGHEKLKYVAGYSTIITTTQVKNINLWEQAIDITRNILNNNNYDTEIYY